MGYLKAVRKSDISRRAYIQNVCEDLTGILSSATELLTFKRPTRSNTACSATRKLKKKSVTAWDSLLERTTARVPVNRVEIEQPTYVWYVKVQYVESFAANDAYCVCNKVLKACLFYWPRYLKM